MSIKRTAMAMIAIAIATVTFRFVSTRTIRVLTKGLPKVNRVPAIVGKGGEKEAMKERLYVRFISGTISVVAGMGILLSLSVLRAQAPPPPDAPDVVDFSKLLPLLPEAPPGWKADKPEGSTSDVGGFKLTNVHRDYKKGEGDKVPTA